MPRKKHDDATPASSGATAEKILERAVVGTDGSPFLDEDILNEFLTRQKECLLETEKQLLELENNACGEDCMAGVLRFLHTLKGESGLLGFTDLADVCHAAEDMLQDRDPADCVETLLRLHDWIVARVGHLAGENDAPAAVEEIIATFAAVSKSAAPQAATPASPARPRTNPDLGPLNGDPEMLPEFLSEAGEHLEDAEEHLLTLESNPDDSEALAAIFRAFHTLKGLAGFLDLGHIQDFAHRSETMLDQARKGAIRVEGPIADLTFGAVDMLKQLIEDVGTAMTQGSSLVLADGYDDLLDQLIAVTEGEIPAATTAAAPEPAVVEAPAAAEAADEPDRVSGFIPLNLPPKAQEKASDEPASGFIPLNLPAKKAAPEPATAPATPPAAGTTSKITRLKEAVRVDADRLDHLVDTIGELVIAESMVSQSADLDTSTSPHLQSCIDHLDKITRDLQEIGMSLRMVPIRPVFQKMARLVRDLAAKTGRKITFDMSGEDTELDKAVVDKIGDPLVHMVRNAVDHGIEKTPQERIDAGKPEAGQVDLHAYHKGGRIHIEISDDGRGLDKNRILAKARERGIVRDNEVLSEREIYNLIFKPGFSTAEQVTEISGRGVGMDVVRRFIEALRGTVEIQSELGQGSTFCISLPLTLAIIEGMIVGLAGVNYIIPTLSIVRLIRPQPGEVTTVLGDGEMISVNEELVPVFRLGRLFSADGETREPHEGVLMIIEDDNRRAALLVDELVGQQQIVIKSLSEPVQDTVGVAGGAILSDGNVALILDVSGIVRIAQNRAEAGEVATPA
ncbi:MAG: chemotaxis protein CheA [bacterium]|nr:chemotaxis protein CheA [bacterium]